MFNELFERKGLSLSALRIFCEVAEAGSLVKAADNDQHRASSYSRTLSKLEEFFEFKVFTREGKKNLGELTEQGQRLRTLATEYFNALISLSDNSQLPEIISIAAGETILQWLICSNINRLRDQLSETRIELVSKASDAIVAGVSNGTLDFGILESADFPKHFGKVELGSLEYALFLSQALAAKFRRTSEKEMLAKLPLAGLEHLGMFATQLDRAARTEGYQLNFAVMFTSFPQVAQALRAGNLAGFLPTLAGPELAKHGLKMVNLPFLKPLSISIALIWNARLAPFRPYIAKTSTSLISILKFGAGSHAP